MTIDLVVPPDSLGPRRNAELLTRGLVARGIDARLVDHPRLGRRANVHLSNSSRSLLLPLARQRDCLVTLHDVVPRDRRLRRVLNPVQFRILRRHRVIVHSRHAADLLRDQGCSATVGVVPLALPVTVPDTATRTRVRARIAPDHSGPVLVLAGTLKIAKGVVDVVDAARSAPEAHLVLMGKVHDRPTADALAAAPSNVTVVERADDEQFSHVLAAADAMLLPRTDSVGETSGPLVMAHALGTPVAMLGVGSAPEYRLPEDLVLPAGSTPAELVGRASRHAWQRTAETADEQLSRVVDRYIDEFQALDWLPDGVPAHHTDQV